MTDTSINLTDVDTHLDSSEGITDTLEPAIDDIVREERAVIGASGGYAPAEAAVNLPQITDAWRANDAKLRTIHDVLINNGATGTVTGLDTDDLRDDVADANGVDSRTGFEIRDDGLDIIVDGGTGADIITVTQNPDGSSTITVQEEGSSITELFTLTPEETERLLIDGGIGNDTITINPYIRPRVGPPTGLIVFEPASTPPIGYRINGGSGHDTITGGTGNDHIDAGVGRDYVDGGAGDDRIRGGDGFDTIYGGRGEDILWGGDDNDYLDGGLGDDKVHGQGGNDIVGGGHGDDRITGGTGDDVLIGGTGIDSIYDANGNDNDTVYAEAQDDVDINVDATNNVGEIVEFEIDSTVTDHVTVSGSQTFQDRVNADLATLAAIPTSARVQERTNDSGFAVTIEERTGTGPNTGNAAQADNKADAWEDAAGNPGSGSGSTLFYHTTRTALGSTNPWSERPPIVGLHHEFVHAEDYALGELDRGRTEQADYNGRAVGDANNRELSALGLDFDDDNDNFDNDAAGNANPGTALGPEDIGSNTRQDTENSFRDALGLPLRERY